MAQRYYPEDSCCFYVEKLIVEPGHSTGNSPFKTTRRSKPEPMEVCVWGYGEQFERLTGLRGNTFLRSRINHDALPVAGQKMRYRIHQAGPVGFLNAPIPTAKLPKELPTKASDAGENTPPKDDVKAKKGKKK